MSEIMRNEPVELTEDELDLVSAGAAAAAGLVAVAVDVSHSLNNINVANHSLNNNKVFVLI